MNEAHRSRRTHAWNGAAILEHAGRDGSVDDGNWMGRPHETAAVADVHAEGVETIPVLTGCITAPTDCRKRPATDGQVALVACEDNAAKDGTGSRNDDPRSIAADG
ncbi:MAG TPA: hypothetical protein VNA69_19810 [Thermoanaerobaculia bacterium]|nr:hypothetical protein [Thermoanaerobaculia bacterium]